jgi:hypothetical protein
VVSGQALQKPGMKSCGVCALGCSAFHGSDRLSPSLFKKGEASPFAARFAGDIGPRSNSPGTGFEPPTSWSRTVRQIH